MTRRNGMSLTEVLVALFILTIGVIGILTMFPLGAAQMARAVRDDRSAQAASNADAYMRWYWATYVANNTISGSPNWPNQDSFLVNGSGLFDNPAQVASIPPGYPQFQGLQPLQVMQAAVQGNASFVGQISYPVIVDPMGGQARQWSFGDSPNFTQIPRYSLQFSQQQPTGNIVAQPQLSGFNYRASSLVDSLGYNENGTPTNDLEMRYNWLYVLQRPQAAFDYTSATPPGPNNNLYNSTGLSMMNMTVVVFDRRAFLYPPSSVPGFETVLSASFTTGLTTVAISPANALQALDLKPGSWVMDATIASPQNAYPIRQANFYRVVSVVELNGQVNLELQTPISPPVGYSPLGFTYTGTLVALNGVSGVFVRPPIVPYP